MFPKRVGLVVWVNDIKQARNLERIGSVHYISKRLNYVLIYVNESDLADKVKYLDKLHFVKRVERSHRAELNAMFSEKALVASK